MFRSAKTNSYLTNLLCEIAQTITKNGSKPAARRTSSSLTALDEIQSKHLPAPTRAFYHFFLTDSDYDCYIRLLRKLIVETLPLVLYNTTVNVHATYIASCIGKL